MSRHYRLAPEAQLELDAIGQYLAEESVDAALKVIDALEDAFERLAANPGIGHSRDDLTDLPVKFWSVFSYLVIYDPQADPLTVLSVVHGARDVRRLLQSD